MFALAGVPAIYLDGINRGEYSFTLFALDLVYRSRLFRHLHIRLRVLSVALLLACSHSLFSGVL